MSQQADIEVTVMYKLIGKAIKQFKKHTTEIAKNGDIIKRTFDKIDGKWRQVSKTIQKGAHKSKMEFQGWAMSMMFFGMALKRAFDMIWKSSTKTFNDVMASVEGTTTGFQMMDGALKFLGFTAGQALEPIAMFLVPIIDKISQWVGENEKLFAALAVGAGVLGTFFMLFGMGALAIAGFIDAGMKLAAAWPAITAAVGSAGFGSVMVALGWVTVAILAAIVLWKTNFGGFADTLKAIWASVVTNMKTIFSGLKLVFTGIWDVITGVFEGNFQKIQVGFAKLFLGVVKIAYGIMRMLQDVMLNIINFIIMAAIDIITLPMKMMVESVKAAMEWLGLGTSGVDKVLSGINAVRNFNPLDDLGINSVIETTRGMEDKALNVAGDFIVNLDTAEDADSLVSQIQDAIGRGA